MSVTVACLRACVGGYSSLILSLHYEGMTTNEEICRAILRFTSTNHEPVIHTYTLQGRLGPLCCDTQQLGERGIEMRYKKKKKKERVQ